MPQLELAERQLVGSLNGLFVVVGRDHLGGTGVVAILVQVIESVRPHYRCLLTTSREGSSINGTGLVKRAVSSEQQSEWNGVTLPKGARRTSCSSFARLR